MPVPVPARRSDPPRNRLLGAGIAVLGAVLLTAVRPVWTIDPDAAAYVGLGQSIAAGTGYALQGVPHTKYPPGWPLLLSGLIRVAGPEAWGVFQAALVACLLATVALTAAVVRRLGYPEPVALSVAAAVGLSQTFFDLSVVYLRTETLFTAASLAALLAYWGGLPDGRHDPGAPARPPGRWPGLAAGFAILAVLTRLAGVTLAAAGLPWLLDALRRRPGGARDERGARRAALRAVVFAAACLLALVAWQVRARAIAAHAPDSVDYGRELLVSEPRDLTKVDRVDNPPLDAPALARRVAGNLEVFARASAVLLTNVDRAGSRLLVGALLALLVAAGLARMAFGSRATSRRRSAAAWVAGTVALYLVWPFNQQERFYVPLLPLLLLAAGEGLLALLGLARGAWSRPGTRLVARIAGGGLLLLLASQRSDHPTLAGRWSTGYAALLGVAALAWLASLRLPRLPEPPPAAAWLLPALFLLPFAQRRFVEWPARVAAFEARRSAEPRSGPLAEIDVDPRLERVAVFLARHTPTGTVLMTDVPKMLAILSGRRCVPFVYRVQPPEVLVGSADLVFYTGEISEAASVLDAVADRFEPVLQLDPVDDGTRVVVPTVWRPR